MRVRAMHPVGHLSSCLKDLHLFEVPPLVSRCLNRLFKHVLPTLLILFYFGFIVLYLAGLIEQAKQENRQTRIDGGYVVAQGLEGK